MQIEDAIAKGGIEMVVQPIVDMVAHAKGEIRNIGWEALARFPKLDMGPADVFAQARRVDEEHATDLEVRLDLACIRAAVTLLPRLAEHQWLAVNMLPATLADHRLRHLLLEMMPLLMKRMELDADAYSASAPHRWRLNGTPPLVIEISERQPIDDYLPFDNQLEELRQSRFKLAIDDLGIGDSSWWRISNLEPDIFKIDRELVEGINRHRGNRRILRTIIYYARSARIDFILPEGVEHPDDRDRLINLGLDYGQGYLLGRPVSPDEAFGDVIAESSNGLPGPSPGIAAMDVGPGTGIGALGEEV
jgi:EAL domain-containing protein (putative c-di-GMP-specific phosphodiesterase class I)